MRRYIQQEDLIDTLQQILSSENSQLKEVCNEVILYRATKNSKRYSKAASMLFVPVRIKLCLFNLVLLPVTAMFFMHEFPFETALANCAVSMAVMAWMVIELFFLVSALKKTRACKQYLIVDELLARRILILNRTKTNTNRIKVAK